MQKQTQVFKNNTGADMLVDVEMTPERYLLRPGESMEISYDHAGEGPGLIVNVHPRGLQIFLDDFDSAVVTINRLARVPCTWPVPPHS
jgi:hypothetical protein